MTLVVVGLILSAPFAQAHGHPLFAATIYTAFHFVCHQIPERSFHLAGYQFAVCARCTGLYSGFMVATTFYPLARSLRRTDTPPRIWLLLAAVPLAIDFSLGYFGIWANTHLSRLLTGALLGAVSVFYIMPGLVQLSASDWRSLLAIRGKPASGLPAREKESAETR
jgi:uncharacterized membrane protein